MDNETKERLARVIALQAELDVRKALYEELDRLTLELQASGFSAATLNGCEVTLTDNFRVNNTCFRPAGVKRFEIRVKAVRSAV